MTLEFHNKIVNSAYYIWDIKKMNTILDKISKYTSSSMYLAQSNSLKINYYDNRCRFEDIININIDFLVLFGEKSSN